MGKSNSTLKVVDAAEKARAKLREAIVERDAVKAEIDVARKARRTRPGNWLTPRMH
jgi:hypothetical protein